VGSQRGGERLKNYESWDQFNTNHRRTQLGDFAMSELFSERNEEIYEESGIEAVNFWKGRYFI